jgi:hypothetical protein
MVACAEDQIGMAIMEGRTRLHRDNPSRAPGGDPTKSLTHQVNNDLGIILAQCELLLGGLENRPAEAVRVRSII